MGWGVGAWGSLHWGSTEAPPSTSAPSSYPVTVLGTVEGPISGGTQVTLVSTAMSVDACVPIYDGTLDGWSSLSTGGGVAYELSAERAIILNSGSTGGVAGLSRTTTESNLDVEITCEQLRDLDLQAEVVLRTASDTEFRIRLQGGVVDLLSRVNGVDFVTDATIGRVNRSLNVRLIRVGGSVYVLLGRVLVAVVAWTTGSANIQVLSRGGAAKMTRFARLPVVLFGGVPSTYIASYDSATGRGIVVTPSYPSPTVVDIEVYGCNGITGTAPAAFEYVLPPRLIVAPARALEVLHDAILSRS